MGFNFNNIWLVRTLIHIDIGIVNLFIEGRFYRMITINVT